MTPPLSPKPSVRSTSRCRGVTLIELLCVVGIIAILVSLFLPAAAKALNKARRLRGDNDGPVHMERLARVLYQHVAPLREYSFPTKDALLTALPLPHETGRFVRSSRVDFRGLDFRDPPEKPVFYVHSVGGGYTRVYLKAEVMFLGGPDGIR